MQIIFFYKYNAIPSINELRYILLCSKHYFNQSKKRNFTAKELQITLTKTFFILVNSN
jgi:hypothetical protein